MENEKEMLEFIDKSIDTLMELTTNNRADIVGKIMGGVTGRLEQLHENAIEHESQRKAELEKFREKLASFSHEITKIKIEE